MIWVVNGLRRKHDKDDFYRSLSAARVTKLKPLTYELTAAGGALLRDWIGCREAVYFDFGDESSSLFGVPVLWRLSPTSCARRVILSPVPVANFVEALLNGVKAKGINMLVSKIPAPRLTPLVRIPLRGFQAHLARKRWRQSRRRF
jgi:hypothetical protein